MKKLALTAIALLVPATAHAFGGYQTPAQRFQGPYFGIKAGYQQTSPNNHTNEEKVDFSTGTVSAYAGLNIPLGSNLVVGVETQFGSNFLEDKVKEYGYKQSNSAEAVARLGFAQGNFMPYLRYGIGLTQTEISKKDAVLAILKDETESLTYYTYGAGLEMKVIQNLSIRGEFQHRSSEKKEFDLDSKIDFSAKDNIFALGAAFHF
ncbi:outer membrane protein [Polycladidibacter stylochi]|uniref:outer membrane protein n=1 Tax=Polycladidibacter stylochi TaxID=1807766 RepID=UPI000A3EA17E|nr:outer membrane beta-barrel protein [Pseudovibrio stylochi]